ncbi:MAG: hypothetical protein K0R99_3792 [Microbacterium sp.]|uniref:recombinase family protein n=1 Tax=Microbacterium sp. TaxID=51671 RepID=UPI00260C3E5C|nr:recombinase family protein [Microbacterium sp.]MDF2562346.1 hypothetical protein [Microbacterium sp.]
MLLDLYCRLSKFDDLSDGLERQESDLRKWAHDNGHTVRKVWRDAGTSGFKQGVTRAAFNGAIKAVTTGEVPGLAVWRLDRLSRQGAGQVGLLLDDLAKVGGAIFFASNGLNTADENHRLMLIFSSEQARAESKSTSNRVMDKNRSLIEAGLPILGRRRFGYLPADKSIGRVVNSVAHPDEAPLVRELFDSYLAGASVMSLADRMGWRPFRVRETLSAAAYIGELEVKGVKYTAAPSVERLIDRDTFEAVQARLSVNAGKHGPDNKSGARIKHLLTGIAKCGVCGRTMSYRNNYLCVENLSHPTIKGEILESKVELALIKLLQEDTAPADPATSGLKAIQAEIAELEEKKADILSGLSNGLKMGDLLPYLSPVTKALEEASERRTALLNASVEARITAEIADTIKAGDSSLVTGLKTGTALFKMSMDDQRTLIRNRLDVVVNKGRGDDRIVITPRL